MPFRESKLTQLFQNYFVGKGHCAGLGRVILLVNVSPAPSVFDETLQVLKFSALANQVMMEYVYPLPYTDWLKHRCHFLSCIGVPVSVCSWRRRVSRRDAHSKCITL